MATRWRRRRVADRMRRLAVSAAAFFCVAVQVIADSPANPDRGRWDSRAETLRNSRLRLVFAASTTARLLNANDAHLLYPGMTSPIVVRLDGRRDFVLTSRTISTAPPVPIPDGVRFSYDCDGVLVIVDYTMAGESVRIAVSAMNRDVRPHHVAVRLLLDTQIDQNDGSPFFISGLGLIQTETEWTAAPFTDWFGYDQYPNPRVIAYGRLETPPYRTILAYWRRVDLTSFDYRPGGVDFSHDSCILTYYDLGRLEPGGQSRVISLAYGSGPPIGADQRRELVHALKLFRDACSEKLLRDAATMAEIDRLSLTALMNSESFRDRLRGLSGGAIEGYVQTVLEIGVQAAAGGVRFSVVDVLALPATIFVDSLIYADRESRVIKMLAQRYSKYVELIGTENFRSDSQIAQRIREILESEIRMASDGGFHELNTLIAGLENGSVRLPEDYPFGEVIDLLDRARRAHLMAAERETISFSLSPSGRGMIADMVGSLYPHLKAMQAVGRREREARAQESAARIVSWAGTAGVVGGKVCAVVLSSGLSLGAEAVLGAVTFVGSTALNIASAVTDANSDQAHFLIATQAQIAWEHEIQSTLRQIEAVTRGVPLARKTDGKIEVAGVDLRNRTANASSMAVAEGVLRFQAAGGEAVESSVLFVTPSLGPEDPPVSFHKSRDAQPFGPGLHQIPFQVNIPSPGTVRQRVRSYRTISYVTDGLRDIHVVSQPFEVNWTSEGESGRIERLAEGTIRRGETVKRTIAVANSQAMLRIMLDYEGSHLALHIYDPEGRHTGLNFETGAVETGIPNSQLIQQPAGAEIIIERPAAGSYRVEIQAVETHREESFVAHVETVDIPSRPQIVALPDTVELLPDESPDLVTIEINEITHIHDAGALTVVGAPAHTWRVSGPLTAGGSARIDLRRPGDLLRNGVQSIEIRGSRGGTATVALRYLSGPAAELAARCRPIFERFREFRRDALRRSGMSEDLWESSRFGAPISVTAPLQAFGPPQGPSASEEPEISSLVWLWVLLAVGAISALNAILLIFAILWDRGSSANRPSKRSADHSSMSNRRYK